MAPSVIIVGAGITGTLMAWRMARRGWKVVVLEARHVGAGSSSRTAAGIRQQFGNPENVRAMRYSVDFYRRFVEQVGGETTPLVQNGYLFLYDLAEALDGARQRVRMQQAAGLHDVVLLEGSALTQRFPYLDGNALLGGTFCPSDGFLRPDVVYQEAIAAAVRLGAKLVQGAPVESVTHGPDGRIRSVTTPKGTFQADYVVDATNAWSAGNSERLGGVPLPVTPLKRYLWFIERAGSMGEAEFTNMPLLISPQGAYCRPENHGSLLCGYAHDARPEPGFSYEDQDTIEAPYFHRTGPETLPYEVWMMLAQSVPAIGEFAGITATTSGYYGTSPDHNPFLDLDPAVPNLVRLVGFSGHGAMFGPFSSAVGELLLSGAAGADRPDHIEVLGEPVPLAPFRIDREFVRHEAMVI